MNFATGRASRHSFEGNVFRLATKYFMRASRPQISLHFFQRTQALRHLLEVDLPACDAKWTMFMCAALRSGSQLQPFPPLFITATNGLDVRGLVNTVKTAPSLSALLGYIRTRDYRRIDQKLLDLLYWVLLEQRDFELHTVGQPEVTKLFCRLQQRGAERPTHVLRVQQKQPQQEYASSRTSLYGKCVELTNGNGRRGARRGLLAATGQGFYSDRLDNFYALLANSFTQSEPVALSTDLRQLLERNSQCGTAHAGASNMLHAAPTCVALCEYVHHPEHVRSTPLPMAAQTAMTGGGLPSMGGISMFGAMPTPATTALATAMSSPHGSSALRHKLITVRKPDLVRISHLFLYGNAGESANRLRQAAISRFMARYRYVISATVYVLVVTAFILVREGRAAYWLEPLAERFHNMLDVAREFLEK